MRQKLGREEKNRPTRCSAHLRSQPCSLCICVCLWGGRTSNLHLQSGERGEQIARLWLGIKWKRARTNNKQTGSFLCLCSPFLSRSCSPSGSSISISRVLSSRLQRELGLNQSNCQRWNGKLSCYHEIVYTTSEKSSWWISGKSELTFIFFFCYALLLWNSLYYPLERPS